MGTGTKLFWLFSAPFQFNSDVDNMSKINFHWDYKHVKLIKEQQKAGLVELVVETHHCDVYE